MYTYTYIYVYMYTFVYVLYYPPPNPATSAPTLKPQLICVGKCLPGAPHERHHTPVLKNTPYALLPTT